MKTLLRNLTEIPAPSGHEDGLRDFVRNLVKPHADEVRVDALGNLIVRKGRQAKNGRRILLAAHLDEVGLVVSHVDADGFARFSALGGFSPLRRVGARVKFLNGARGVICLERASDFKDRAPGIEKFFIDTGASSRKDVPVRVGDAAVFEADFDEPGGRIVSRALDNRIGVALLIESLCALKPGPHEVHYVFTVQEELGARGAGPAAYGIDPEIALSVDVTPASDQPGAEQRNPIMLGRGPAIKIKDSPLIADPALVERLTRLAVRKRIPHQFEVTDRIGTDLRAAQIARAGVRAGGISIPLRNLHSPSEIIDLADAENAARLLAALLRATDL